MFIAPCLRASVVNGRPGDRARARLANVNPESILGHTGAPKSDIISGPVTQKKGAHSITLWVTQACIDCDISRENCPAVYEHNYEKGQTKIKESADFFAELENVKRAIEQCPVNALGLEIEKS